jgi:hypothetical protein
VIRIEFFHHPTIISDRLINMTPHRLRQLLDYNPRTGVFTWRVDRGGTARIGRVAGANHNRGYRQINVDGTIYLGGRLAFLYMKGRWPKEIDHINGNRSDDRWSNLREATRIQNCRNTKLKTGMTGFRGVYWDNRLQKYRAKVTIERRAIQLGCFDTPDAAHAAYCIAARKHFGEFARFS